jgi:uncharacterized membrane protein YgcG
MDDTLAIILLAGVPLLVLLSGFLYHLRSVRKERERRAVLVRERLAAIREADYQRMREVARRSTPTQSTTVRSVPASYTTSNTTSASDDILNLALINSITSSSESSRPTSWSSSDSSSSWSSSDSSSSWSSSDSGSSPSSDW